MKHKISVLIFSIIILGLLSVDCHAQLLIEKGKVQYKANPGEHVEDTVTIHNTSDKAMDIRVYWEDFEYVAPFDGNKQFYPLGMTERSCGKFGQFSPQEFNLPAFGSKKVNFSVNLPQDAKGTFNGVLFFEKRDESTVKTTGFQLVTRIGCLVFIDINGSSKGAQISGISAASDRILGDFENKGQLTLFPKGTYYIIDSEGLAVDRGEIKALYLPLAAKAEFSITMSKDILPGSYTAVLTFDLDGGDSLVKEVDFTKDERGQTTITATRD